MQMLKHEAMEPSTAQHSMPAGTAVSVPALSQDDTRSNQHTVYHTLASMTAQLCLMLNAQAPHQRWHCIPQGLLCQVT